MTPGLSYVYGGTKRNNIIYWISQQTNKQTKKLIISSRMYLYAPVVGEIPVCVVFCFF